MFEKNALYFYFNIILIPVGLLVIELRFSNVTVLVTEYRFDVLFSPLQIMMGHGQLQTYNAFQNEHIHWAK